MKTLLVFISLILFAALPVKAAELSQAPTDLPSMQKLAGEGDSNAQLNLGNYYATPHNAAPDFAQAAIWYRKAADQGNAEAQYRLGDLYFNGKGGLKQSYEEAFFWFSLAAQAGPKPFAADRDDTKSRLTAEQLADVQKRLEIWKPVSTNN